MVVFQCKAKLTEREAGSPTSVALWLMAGNLFPRMPYVRISIGDRGLSVSAGTTPIFFSSGYIRKQARCSVRGLYVRPFQVGYHQAQEGSHRRQARKDIHTADQ